MKYVDTVRLAMTTSDGYGDQHVEILSEVAAIFIQRTGVEQGNNETYYTADALVYLNPKDGTVTSNSFRLEGMYVIAQPFGQSQEESWYKITGVNVGQRKLLTNEIDNVLCTLQKVAGLPYVS